MEFSEYTLIILCRLTAIAGIVHQDNFLKQVARRPVDDAGDGSQEHGPGLVVENNYNRRAG